MRYNTALKGLLKLKLRGKLTQRQYVSLIKQARVKYKLKNLGEITPQAVSTKREVPRDFTGDITNIDEVSEYLSAPLVV